MNFVTARNIALGRPAFQSSLVYTGREASEALNSIIKWDPIATCMKSDNVLWRWDSELLNRNYMYLNEDFV